MVKKFTIKIISLFIQDKTLIKIDWNIFDLIINQIFRIFFSMNFYFITNRCLFFFCCFGTHGYTWEPYLVDWNKYWNEKLSSSQQKSTAFIIYTGSVYSVWHEKKNKKWRKIKHTEDNKMLKYNIKTVISVFQLMFLLFGM